MLGFLATSIGRKLAIGAAILLVIGAAFAYYEWSKAEIAALHAEYSLIKKQADDLSLAKDKLEKDVLAIKNAQDEANIDLAKARNDAARTSREVRNTQAQLNARAKIDPRAVENQVNLDHQNMMKALEDLSK